MLPIIRLPRGLQLTLESTANALLQPAGRHVDFTRPAGEEALVPCDSVSWRIFKNPVALLVGGIAAVILELAEPAVRTGVWEFSSFRADPVGRLRRTGLAAMVTVYGARSIALPMIQGVVRMHARVAGSTPGGAAFCASDTGLLSWVQATASFGFAAAYSGYVARLTPADLDRLYREGAPAAQLYGALGAPRSSEESQRLFDTMHARLERSEIVFEFLRIMQTAPALPRPIRWMQPMLVRAAVDLIPERIRNRLELTKKHGLRPMERLLVRMAGTLADRIVVPNGPPALSCQRLGLSKSYLYAREN